MARINFIFSETSPAAPGTVASSQLVQNAGGFLPAGVAGPMQGFDAVDIIAELQGATGGTLDVYAQLSPNDGGAWYDFVHFAQLAPGASAVIYHAPISNATNTLAPTLIGKNLAPALAGTGTGSPSVVNGAFSDRMRLVFVAGSGTTKGANIVVHVMPQRSESSR